MADVKIKTQKIIKIGNSYALTLDREFLDQNQMPEGTQLIARYDADSASVTFSRPDTYASSQNRPLQAAEKKAVFVTKFDKEFLAWVEDILREDREALYDLAHRDVLEEIKKRL